MVALWDVEQVATGVNQNKIKRVLFPENATTKETLWWKVDDYSG